MKIAFITCFSFLFTVVTSFSQNKKVTCPDLHDGIFYYYPKNSDKHYISRREGDLQYESTVQTGDTTLWQVKWAGDCEYSLKYLSGGKDFPKETIDLIKKHKLVYEIIKTTDRYYIFKGYIDKTSNPPIQTDTMWLNEKTVVANNELFRPVQNNAALKKAHFSDTSQYAVLYLYRPGKLTNSLANYLIYFDDIIMCVARNKSGYLFKIMKEGKFTLKSKLYKDAAAVELDVKFGNVYYVKSMIHWGVFKRLYNFKLEMALVKPEDGKIEFEEVNL